VPKTGDGQFLTPLSVTGLPLARGKTAQHDAMGLSTISSYVRTTRMHSSARRVIRVSSTWLRLEDPKPGWPRRWAPPAESGKTLVVAKTKAWPRPLARVPGATP